MPVALTWLPAMLSAVLGPFARVLLAGVNLLLRGLHSYASS